MRGPLGLNLGSVGFVGFVGTAGFKPKVFKVYWVCGLIFIAKTTLVHARVLISVVEPTLVHVRVPTVVVPEAM